MTGLIEEEPKKAIVFSENLANIYRHFLERENQDLILLKEALSFADRYMQLLKMRYEDTLSYTTKILKNPDLYVVPMALQQVLENVVKHNEISLENPMAVNIYLEEDDYLTVENIVHKKAKTNNDQNKPTGLRNLQEQYAYFTDKKLVIKRNAIFHKIGITYY